MAEMNGGLSLQFAAGKRPGAKDIVRLAESAQSGAQFGIAHRPPDAEGWLELLSTGLTFDCTGLAPAPAAPPPPCHQAFGLEPAGKNAKLEAITLAPGPHLAGGERLMPVIRAMVGLGAALARLDGVKAVCWLPAGSWMEPGYFIRIVGEWLQGGAFPALGLTTLERRDDGAMLSRGLAYLAGQELLLEPRLESSPADAARLAVRLIDEMVYAGPLTGSAHYSGPNGEDLRAEPEAGGTVVRVRWVA